MNRRRKVFIYVLLWPSSLGFLSRIPYKTTSSSSLSPTILNSDLCLAKRSDNFTVPIFPLRKTVRLPTESLTLNLYEERYIDMAEAILASPNVSFGVIYSSHKPQIIKHGGFSSPVVPILEPGDIGVLCQVTESEDRMIATVGGQARRRIRLQAQGLARFQVLQVVHNGYATIDGSLPFIVVQAELYQDELHRADELQIDLRNTARRLHREDDDDERISFAMASARLRDAEVDKRLRALHVRLTSERFNSISS
jgi:Lon protease-like protein